MGDLPNLKFTAPLVSRISELEAEIKRLAADCNTWEKRSDRVEAEIKRLRETTLDRAADIFVGNALENDSPNFRTHTALVGDETWEITVRRADGKTPDQIIHKLRAEVKRLAADCDAWEKRSDRVEAENKDLKLRLEEREDQLTHFESEYNALLEAYENDV